MMLIAHAEMGIEGEEVIPRRINPTRGMQGGKVEQESALRTS